MSADDLWCHFSIVLNTWCQAGLEECIVAAGFCPRRGDGAGQCLAQGWSCGCSGAGVRVQGAWGQCGGC